MQTWALQEAFNQMSAASQKQTLDIVQEIIARRAVVLFGAPSHVGWPGQKLGPIIKDITKIHVRLYPSG